MASGYNSTPDPTKNGMGYGGWTKVTSGSSVTTVKFAAIANVSGADATVTFTSHDYISGNSEQTASLTIGAGTILPGLFTGLSVASGEVMAAYQMGEMPA